MDMNNTNWIKEFESKFDDYDFTTEQAVVFITSLLNSRTEELIKKLEGVEKGIEWMQEGSKKDLKGYTKGFNDGLSRAKELAKEL